MTEPGTGFERPAFPELLDQIRRDINGRVPNADALLPQGVLSRLAEVTAAQVHDLHAHLDWVARMQHPLWAEGSWLEDWGRVLGVQRKPAAAAAGGVTFAGTDGVQIPTGTRLRRTDGTEYEVSAGATVAGGSATVTVEALAAGAAGNADAGVTLSLLSPITGLDNQGTVAGGGLVGGADREADGRPGIEESYRSRVVYWLRRPPHGGAADDYTEWTLEVPGVTRAWVLPEGLGDGTVLIYFMMDDVRAGQNGIPQGDPAPTYSGDLALVAGYLESHADPTTGEQEGRPATAEVIVAAPAPVALDVTLAGLSPDTPEIRAAIEAELADMLRRRAEPGVTLSRSWIWEAVAVASGEDRHEVMAPAADVPHQAGEIPVLGTVAYS